MKSKYAYLPGTGGSGGDIPPDEPPKNDAFKP